MTLSSANYLRSLNSVKVIQCLPMAFRLKYLDLYLHQNKTTPYPSLKTPCIAFCIDFPKISIYSHIPTGIQTSFLRQILHVWGLLFPLPGMEFFLALFGWFHIFMRSVSIISPHSIFSLDHLVYRPVPFPLNHSVSRIPFFTKLFYYFISSTELWRYI